MDFLLSIRKEWSFGFKRSNDSNKAYYGIGIFIGPICFVITNMRLLRATLETREEAINKITYEAIANYVKAIKEATRNTKTD